MQYNDISNEAPPIIIVDVAFFLAHKKFDMEAVAPLVRLSMELNLVVYVVGTRGQRIRTLRTFDLLDLPVTFIMESEIPAILELPNVKFYVNQPELHAKYRTSIPKESLLEVYYAETLKGE